MLDKIRTYARISNLWPIARRYFVNNFYDGMLTVLGILLGFFIIIIKGNQNSIESNLVILTGIGSSISMFISGLSGSYLSERAEQKKLKKELEKAMALSDLEFDNTDPFLELNEIEKAMLKKIKRRRLLRKKALFDDNNNKKKSKTIQDKAEQFAILVVSFVNGTSPFLGGIVPLIPFFLVLTAGIITFIYSFLIILLCIILLGIFLGTVSKESIIKNIIQMVVAFLITILISLLLLR
ncbi:MAG: VIT1/CCC1 transporter family protein [Candidatus Heimdallarchaeota archaeon]